MVPFSRFFQTVEVFRMKLHSPQWPHSILLCSLPHCRAFAKLHADCIRDRGAYSLHPLYTHRCRSPGAPPAEPELRQGHPFCSCIFHREHPGSSSGASSFFCFEGLHTFLFSGSLMITFSFSLFYFLFFWLVLTEGPISILHLKCTWLQVTMLIKDILSSRLPFNVNSEKSGLWKLRWSKGGLSLSCQTVFTFFWPLFISTLHFCGFSFWYKFFIAVGLIGSWKMCCSSRGFCL